MKWLAWLGLLLKIHKLWSLALYDSYCWAVTQSYTAESCKISLLLICSGEGSGSLWSRNMAPRKTYQWFRYATLEQSQPWCRSCNYLLKLVLPFREKHCWAWLWNTGSEGSTIHADQHFEKMPWRWMRWAWHWPGRFTLMELMDIYLEWAVLYKHTVRKFEVSTYYFKKLIIF